MRQWRGIRLLRGHRFRPGTAVRTRTTKVRFRSAAGFGPDGGLGPVCASRPSPTMEGCWQLAPALSIALKQ